MNGEMSPPSRDLATGPSRIVVEKNGIITTKPTTYAVSPRHDQAP